MPAASVRGSASRRPRCEPPTRPPYQTCARSSPPGRGCASLRAAMATKQTEAPVLEFERPVVELERKIDELRKFAEGSPDLQREIRALEGRVGELQREIFADLTAWQTVLLSRHPGRPHTLDYIGRLIADFTELH